MIYNIEVVVTRQITGLRPDEGALVNKYAVEVTNGTVYKVMNRVVDEIDSAIDLYEQHLQKTCPHEITLGTSDDWACDDCGFIYNAPDTLEEAGVEPKGGLS